MTLNRKEQKFFSNLDWEFVNTQIQKGVCFQLRHTFKAGDWVAVYTENSNPIGYGCDLSIAKGGTHYSFWTFGLGGTGGKTGKVFKNILKQKEIDEQVKREKMLHDN